ncbi:ABC transporter ATP-binding protein [Psychrobacillus sp. L4]|uniref:ABC transporter ATP-binding protein n=1 Tax=Psychrobacillus sp. L4 TaxID=3236892 RepID=UPI0036F36784
MLEAVELSKMYKKVKAVDNLNLYVERGEVVGLLGPNGAGKSTAIAMISTLIAPSNGDVRIDNKSALQHPNDLRKILGVVPQEIALYEELTARENLQFFGRIHKMPNAQLNARIEEVLEQIGLQDQPKKLVKHYSGGMKRRLNIGAALLHEPQFLIMDEPTVGIDPQSRNYILETVKLLNKEKKMSILYTSHYMEEVEYLCDRIYIMDSGHIIASGSKDEIKNILSSEKTIRIKLERTVPEFVVGLKRETVISQLQEKGETIAVTVAKDVNLFPKLLSLSEQTGAVLVSVDVDAPSLEDVFLHLTGRALRN